jgi:hypothetical protein
MRWWVTAALLCAVGCGATTPLWYERNGETSWTLPMLRPLENREVIVPVFINGQGPYEFMLDPLSPVTVLDRGVAQALGLYSRGYVRMLTQRDTTQPRMMYEMMSLRAGDLTISNMAVASAPSGALRAGDRPIHGIMGADLLSRTIVIDVDRDAGVVRLSLTGTKEFPADAVELPVGLHRGILRIGAAVNGAPAGELIVTLARQTTSLHPDRIESLGLTLGPGVEHVVDETGDESRVEGRVADQSMTIGGSVQVAGVDLIPYLDRRGRHDVDYDGVVGQNVWSRFRTIVDHDHKRVYLAPRDGALVPGARRRIDRWNEAFANCAATACATLDYDPTARLLTLRRDAGAPPVSYQVTIVGLDETGAELDATLLTITLLRDRTEATRNDPGTHAPFGGAASFAVVDANPI